MRKINFKLRRFSKKALSIFLAFVIVVIGTGLIYMFNPWVKSVEAVWYDDNWSYRQRVPIDTHTASEDNVYNEISIDTATLTTDKLQADCDDLRFTKENGEVLPYQIVSGCDSATTVINVGFDTMPIAPFNIYMYYGNSTAGAGSSTLIHTACGNGCAEGTLASEEKAPSPVAYWRFDDGTGTNAQDSTVNNNDGTLTNGPTWQTEDQCVAGKCLKFDGTDDYISVSDSNSLNTSNISISGWIKINSWDTTNNTSIYNRRTAANVGGVTLETEASAQGTINFYAYIGGSWRLASSTGWNTNTWYHIAATYDGSTMRLFKNGAQVGTTSISGSINNPSSPSVEIGRNIAGTTKAINGFIDELKIYSYARSAAQIQADYNARASGEGASAVLGMDSGQARMTLSNGLVGYWKMDESSANTCTGGVNDSCDSSGNGNNGAWNGNATSAAGKFGNGTTFDGSGDYTSVADSTIFDSTTMTISAWIYKDSLSSGDYREIFSKVAGGSDRYVLGAYDPTDNKIHAYIDDASNCEVTSDNALTASTWTHVAVSLDGSRHKLYINGALNDDVACTETWSSVGGNISWGAYSTTDDYWNGDFDEARIYNRALSSNEVSQLYNFAPGPVAYYNMEEPSGNLSDKSGNGNTGTATGTTSVNGKYGKARSFGTTDYVSITNASILNPNYVSVNAWVKVNSIGTSYDVVTKATSDDATHSPSYGITITSAGKANFFAFTAMDVAYKDRQSSTTLVANTWYHIAGSWDGTTARIYVNGVDETSAGTTSGSGTGVIDYTYTSPIIFGKRTANPASGINGMIDEIRIYNYAQTAKQIVSDMNAGHPAVGSPIGSAVGHWRFDEGVDNRCSGGTNDACNSGNGGSALDGAISGMASPATSTSGWTQSGKVGRGLVFDGTNDYVSTTNITDLTDKFTICSWFNWNGTESTEYDYIASDHESDGNDVNISLQRVVSSGLIASTFRGTNDSWYTTSTLTAITTSGWHHTCAINNGSTFQMYLDGNANGTAVSVSGITPKSSIGTFAIGRAGSYAGNVYFHGSIDEVKVYNYALTADEVKVDMNLGSSQVLGAASTIQPNDIGGMNLWLKADEITGLSDGGSVSTWSDTSGSGNNFTQGTAGSRPTYKTNILNGKPVVRLDGTDDNLVAGSSFLIRTFFVVANYTKGATLGYDGLFTDGANQDAGAMGFSGQTYFSNFTGNTSYINSVNTKEFAPLSTHKIVTWVFDANQTKTWNIGWQGIPGIRFWGGDVAEVIAYNRALTNDERRSVESFLAQKYGITAVPNNFTSTNSASAEYCIPGDSVKCSTPVARWDFEEGTGTTAYDKSGNANNGTLTSGPTWTNGKLGKGLSFDGSDDYVSTSYTPAYINNLTISAWIKRNNTATIHVIASTYNGTGDSGFIFDVFNTNKLSFWTQNSRIQSTGTITDTNWHHVAVTVSGSNVITFYIDGAQAGTSTGSGGNTVSSLPFLIGAQTTAAANPFSGKIDNVRLFNYARSAAQVAWDYNRGEPVGHWKMDECQGTSIKDWSGNSNHGTLTVGASGTQTSAGTCQGSANTAWKDGVTGKINYSLDFDGTDDYVDLGDPSSGIFDPGTGDFTLAFWMKWADNQPKTILSKDNWAGNGNGWLVYTDGASLYYWTGSELSLGSLPASWLHVAITRSGTSITTYVDGKQKSTGTDVRNLANTITLKAGGANDAGKYFSGQIDDVRVYNYALSSTQVKDLFNGGAVNFRPVTGAP